VPFNIGPFELLLVLILALLILGPGKLPEVGSALGRTIREFRKASTDVESSLSVDPSKAAMFEDLARNLEAPHALGMTTVLVHSSTMDHPVQLEIKAWTEPPEHVHHMTEDLQGFLEGVWPGGDRVP